MIKDPIQPTDDDARRILRDLLTEMQHAVLAVNPPDSPFPHLSRIALQADDDGTPMALLSGLATHTRVLALNPNAGLLIAAPPAKGDAMTQSRLSLQVIAKQLPNTGPEHAARLEIWVGRNPKAKVYATLPDFHFWRMEPQAGLLNAGFGKAYHVTAADLANPPA